MIVLLHAKVVCVRTSIVSKNNTAGYLPGGGGGVLLKNCMWMCFEILTLAIPNFVPFTTTCHQYTNFVPKMYPILLKLGTLYHYLLKIHPIYVNRTPFSVMKTLYQNSLQSTPKDWHIYMYTISMWIPPWEGLFKQLLPNVHKWIKFNLNQKLCFKSMM